MPDFDVDFCMEGRDRVIDYVAERYGRERVSQIITYGSMAAKAVVRDVGRVLGHPYGFVDRIAKLIPFETRHHARQGAGAGRAACASSMKTKMTCTTSSIWRARLKDWRATRASTPAAW